MNKIGHSSCGKGCPRKKDPELFSVAWETVIENKGIESLLKTQVW